MLTDFSGMQSARKELAFDIGDVVMYPADNEDEGTTAVRVLQMFHLEAYWYRVTC